MKNDVFTILFALNAFIANAGDTIFSTPPNTRRWNTSYMQQKFSDEFNGTSLNQNVWYVELCTGSDSDGNPIYNRDGEPNNIVVSNGTLKLISRYENGNVDNNCWNGTHMVTNFTGAHIWSRWAPNRYKYGSFEARCFMPSGIHFNYAYWLWGPGGDGYPVDGFTSEIDISEGCEWIHDGSHHAMKSTFHLFPQNGGAEIPLSDDETSSLGTVYEGSWHIYKIIWNPYEVIFYVDSIEKWRRSRYYTGSDCHTNDVGMSQIVTNTLYKDRLWFPNDEMAIMLQMLTTKYTQANSLPATMEVDYVRVKQFFLAPEITLSSNIICTSGTATMDVDLAATNITWQLAPSNLFSGTATGSGTTANIIRASGANGLGKITYTFKMPSGETFTAEKEICLGSPVISGISGPTSTPNNQWATYHAILETSLSAPTAYNWILNPLNGNSVYNYGSTCDIAFYNSGYYQLVVQAKNTCSGSGYGPYYVTGI